MYRDGKEARLPDKLIDAQVKATAKARSRDVVLEDAVEAYVHSLAAAVSPSRCKPGGLYQAGGQQERPQVCRWVTKKG